MMERGAVINSFPPASEMVIPVSNPLSVEERLMKDSWLIDAELCRKSFYDFVQEFWPAVCPEEPSWNWHIEYLCSELQTVAERVVKRLPKKYDLVINIPPGTTKSTICTIMFPAWVWALDPSLRIMSASYSSSLSLEHGDKSRDVIRSDKYRKYFSEIKLRLDKDLKSNYENTKMGTRFSTSVGGTATGMHGHFIIVDDPLNPKQAVSDLERIAANQWLDNTLSTRKVDKAVTPLILIMQRLHVDDCTAHILRKGTAVRHICLPGTYTPYSTQEEEDKNCLVSPPELKTRYNKGYLDPYRLSQSVLDDLRKDMGEYNFCAQIDQRPVPKGGAMFKTEKFNLIPGYNPRDIVASVRYWDKAGTEGGGAYTSGVLMHKMRTGRFLVAGVKRGQWAAPVREEHIKQTAVLDGTSAKIVVEQEPGSGGKESAENTVRRLAGWLVSADRVTGAKEVRAEPYAIQVENGNVDVLIASWTPDFIDEHTSYPMSRYKDQVDAAGGAFNALAFGTLSAGTWGNRR